MRHCACAHASLIGGRGTRAGGPVVGTCSSHDRRQLAGFVATLESRNDIDTAICLTAGPHRSGGLRGYFGVRVLGRRGGEVTPLDDIWPDVQDRMWRTTTKAL